MGNWEDYIIEGTDVLKNKLGIKSFDELKEIEDEIVVEKLSQLYVHGMPGNFDIEHLCNLHKFLFDDIYYFAGQFRTVDMYKITGFEHYEKIPSRLETLFNTMNNKTVNTNSKFEIASYLGEYYLELIDIHPFREGNGRASREFIRQLVKAKFPEYELDYTKVNKENFQTGVIERKNYPSLIAFEIYGALVPKEQVKKAHK